MKKLLALILAAALALSLVACGGGNEQSNSNEIELTLENYATHLNVGASPQFTGKDWLMQPYGEPNSILCNSKMEIVAETSGTSSNYDFVDTVVTVRVSGTYDTLSVIEKEDDVAFSKDITITCDIGGGGWVTVDVFTGIDEAYQIIENSIEYKTEVISISGSVAHIGH